MSKSVDVLEETNRKQNASCTTPIVIGSEMIFS